MKYKRYQIKHVVGMDRYIHALEVIKDELGDHHFRHRYYGKENRIVFLINEKRSIGRLLRKLKESDLILKVLK